jgi:heme oxygenase
MTSASVKMAHDSSAAPRTLLLRLKDETRDEHESLERDLNLLQPDLTLERYRSIVERLFGFYSPWEQAVSALLSEHIPGFAEPREKAQKLWEDLNYLGTKAKIPMCKKLPACQTWPEVLGSLYVTEGATLNGQIISRKLGQTLGLSARRGAAFFSSYGLEVGSKWQTFCIMLQANTPPDKEDAVIGAARQTLLSMHQWLCSSRK